MHPIQQGLAAEPHLVRPAQREARHRRANIGRRGRIADGPPLRFGLGLPLWTLQWEYHHTPRIVLLRLARRESYRLQMFRQPPRWVAEACDQVRPCNQSSQPSKAVTRVDSGMDSGLGIAILAEHGPADRDDQSDQRLGPQGRATTIPIAPPPRRIRAAAGPWKPPRRGSGISGRNSP